MPRWHSFTVDTPWPTSRQWLEIAQ